MHLVNSPLVVIILLSLIKVGLSLEICKDYAVGTMVYSSFYCVDYCCGSCNFRYCCSNETLVVVGQEKCSNTLGLGVKASDVKQVNHNLEHHRLADNESASTSMTSQHVSASSTMLASIKPSLSPSNVYLN